MDKKIKILICYHKPDVLIKDDVFTPIHVGRALATAKATADDKNYEWMLENTIGDDTGDNISEKNSSYNELTAVYWAWKNYDKLGNPDYIGLTHYRRHFIFRESNEVVEEVNAIDENYLKRINYSKDTISHLFDDCDYVAHIGHVDQIYKHYKDNHHIEDLDLAIEILKELHPDYAQTADDYLKMSYANFFNMFIMPKELFFGYCEWLFSILFEFEKQVDLSEKRLFISERLTGIYIEHLKRSGYKQKSLPSTFVRVQTHTPVVLPYAENKIFQLSVTMSSIMKHAEKTTLVDFYLLYRSGQNVNVGCFTPLVKRYGGHTVTFVNVDKELEKIGKDWLIFEFPQHYPLIISDILPNLNKLIYIDERSFFFGDIARFYQDCNNDEFYILGIKDKSASEDERKVCGNAFCINSGRIRKHNLIDKFAQISAGNSASVVFNKVCGNMVGCFPHWCYSEADGDNYEKISYERHRGDVRWNLKAWEHCLLYYPENTEPWFNIQGLLSVYWWEIAFLLSATVPVNGVIKEDALKLMYKQSVDLCVDVEQRRRKEEEAARLLAEQQAQQQLQEQRKNKRSVFKRTADYYKKNGLKATIKKIFQKIRRK